MNDATAKVWKLAEAQRVGEQYRDATRNPDKAVRDQFKVDREIPGTRAWAICQCMGLVTANFSEDEATAIIAALGA